MRIRKDLPGGWRRSKRVDPGWKTSNWRNPGEVGTPDSEMGSGEAKCAPARIWRWAQGQWEGAERSQRNHRVSPGEGGVVAAGRGLSSELLFKTLRAWVLALRPPIKSERH